MKISKRMLLFTACLTALLLLNCTGQKQSKTKGLLGEAVPAQRSVVYLDNWSIYHPGSWSVPTVGVCPTTYNNGQLVNDTAAIIDTMYSQLALQVNAGKITHINYGFARFNTKPVSGSASYNPANSEYEIYFTDAWADAGPGSWSANTSCKFSDNPFPEQINGAYVVGAEYNVPAHTDHVFTGDRWGFNTAAYNQRSYGGLYCAMSKLKAANSGLKVLISIGGWGYPDGERTNLLKHFQDVAADALAIQNGASFENSTRFNPFVTSIKKWMTVFGFDGVDIDWEYPFFATDGATSLKGDDLATAQLQYEAFFRLLRAQLPKNALITTAVSPRSDMLKSFNPYQTLLSDGSIDFINIMAYDYYGAFDKTTGINAPFLDLPGRTTNWSFKDSVDAFAQAVGGTNISKLNAGLAAYGRSFGDVNGTGCNVNGLGCNFGVPGPDFVSLPKGATAGNGSLKYWEILKLSQELNSIIVDCASVSVGSTDSSSDKTPMMLCKDIKQISSPISGVCPADIIIPVGLYLGNIFIGYDNPASITQKADYARSHGLGGSMMWTITGDDADFSLLKAATKQN